MRAPEPTFRMCYRDFSLTLRIAVKLNESFRCSDVGTCVKHNYTLNIVLCTLYSVHLIAHSVAYVVEE